MLFKNLERIKLHPKSHPVILKHHQYEYRKLIIHHYIFVYFVDSTNKEITIFRIFHELEDYQNRLCTNNLKNEKGGKYPQKFYQKLGKAFLNTDAISSLVLQDKKYEKMPADFSAGIDILHCKK